MRLEQRQLRAEARQVRVEAGQPRHMHPLGAGCTEGAASRETSREPRKHRRRKSLKGEFRVFMYTAHKCWKLPHAGQLANNWRFQDLSQHLLIRVLGNREGSERVSLSSNKLRKISGVTDRSVMV